MELCLLRQNVDDEFSMFQEIVQRAREFGLEITVPRTVGKQCHRLNTPYTTVEEYYRRTVMIPLLDHVTSQLQERFSTVQKTVVRLLTLIPANIPKDVDGKRLKLTVPSSLKELLAVYQRDLPVPDLFAVEYASWVRHWEVNEDNKPDSLQATLKACDECRFRNIFVLLKIALTIPVTTCENERSHSQLKLVKSCLRSTMTEDRLSSLLLMKIHRGVAENLNLQDLVNKFAMRHPRRLLLGSLMHD